MEFDEDLIDNSNGALETLIRILFVLVLFFETEEF